MPCDGSAPNVWGCCTAGNLCDEDEGDCDSNDDCMPGLECQADSCPGDKFGDVFPAGQVDCCKKTDPDPAAIPFYSNFVDGIDKRIERWTNDEEPIPSRPRY